MKPRKIKLFWWLATALPLLLAALLMLPALWPRTLDPEECSELYLRYEHNPHINATELHDFPIDDTLAVDVTILQAIDSTGWDDLMHLFGFPEEMIDDYYIFMSQKDSQQRNQFASFSVDKDDFSKRLPVNDPSSRKVIVSYKKQTFSFFHTDKQKIKDCIEKKEFKDLKKKHENKI